METSNDSVTGPRFSEKWAKTAADYLRDQMDVDNIYRKIEEEDLSALSLFLQGQKLEPEMAVRVAKRLLGRVPPKIVAYR